MTPSPADQTDLEAKEQAADRAFARGDLSGAEAGFLAILGTAPSRIDNWLKLATIRRAAGRIPAALDAVGGALRVDPLHFMALLTRARLLEASGDGVQAARAYAHALAQVPDDLGETPLKAVIAHARTIVEAYQDGVERTWDEALGSDPALSPTDLARLDRFKTNALRRTRVYHSDPTHYFYPSLPEYEFHPRAFFPWLEILEAATPAILRELEALISDGQHRAEPYIQYPAGTPVRQWAALNNSLDWTALHLINSGRTVEENARRCPETIAVLEKIGQPQVAGRSPNAMFSLLKPRTRIPPHTGVSNTRLVCHLPLIVPDNCWFRVGATTHEWKVGEAIVFDDTMEHEAANDSDSPRVVMIVDVWHHGLSDPERAAITRLMEAEQATHGMAL